MQPTRPAIEQREVHLHSVWLDASAKQLEQCRSVLSEEENARAFRFRFDEHRRNFVLSHGVLRLLLAKLARFQPPEIAFSYGAKGKPVLRDAGPGIHFNMSHSGKIAVYAFTSGCEIGVDVEEIRPVPEMEDIARRFFCAREAEDLKAFPSQDQPKAFYHCWTRKEAYIKAVGEGLSIPLDQFRVSLESPAQLLEIGGSSQTAQAWTLHDFTPAPEYAGALAYRDQIRPLRAEATIAAGDLLDGLFLG